jgi:hypothetical protein
VADRSSTRTRVQPPPAPAVLEAVIPLQARCRERLKERVLVHIVGGLQVSGKLIAVNDDATITIDDGEDLFDIALQAVAVLEGSRP